MADADKEDKLSASLRSEERFSHALLIHSQRRANVQWSTFMSATKDVSHLVPNDADLERAQTRLLLRENLADRYNKWACICLDDAGFPLSYGFCESPDEDLSVSEDFPVDIMTGWNQVLIFGDYWTFWRKLDEKGQDVLFTILAAAVSIAETIYYDSQKKCWRSRTSSESAILSTDFTLLHDYGVEKNQVIQGTVLDNLAHGRSSEDLKKMMENPLLSELKKRLVKSWSAAFVTGVTNGATCIAVSHLFEAIFAVLDNSGCSFPTFEVANITSSVKADGFNISSATSPSSTGSSGTPKVKRRRLDDKDKKEKKKVEFVPPTKSREYVDLSVAVQDDVNGVPKFLLLVEIFSRGKTIEQARAKFIKELIFVLQCQSEVFGLFFADTDVYLYHVKKDAQEKISVINDTYHLLQYVYSDGILHVAEFQRLILDILTCLVFGVKNIGA